MSLCDDNRPGVHLWGAIVSAVVSLVIPIVGLVAAYTGYKLTATMTRAWFGLRFVAIGLASVLSWLLWIAGVV